MLPPSPEAVRALGATLKWGRYRSAAAYLNAYKVLAQRAGHPWGDVLQRMQVDVRRSCERGQGPPTRAQPLPLARLGQLPWSPEAWVVDGPARPQE